MPGINTISFENEINLAKKGEENININSNNHYIEENKISNRIKKEDLSSIEQCKNLLNEVNPKILEIYEIIELIGSGSESVVFKVQDKKTNKFYAIKLIIIDKNSIKNYKEYYISKSFKNNNIISFYGIYEIKKDELDCIIMDYAKFGTLRDFQKKVLKREELSEQLLCFFALQILKGLQYCHKCKVVHYDLKPQNIIIDEYLNAKLIDFSVSIDYRKITTNTIKLPFRGTSFYMPPEVIKSKTINVKDINKIDLFSLGVILYNLAFGIYPFGLTYEDSKDYDAIYNKIQINNLEFNNEYNSYSKYFIDFLKKLLRKDINKRININQAMNHYWIKGAHILMDEKEKTFSACSFLINLITDHIRLFNNYMNR